LMLFDLRVEVDNFSFQAIQRVGHFSLPVSVYRRRGFFT
jgi:hypothetical protein